MRWKLATLCLIGLLAMGAATTFKRGPANIDISAAPGAALSGVAWTGNMVAVSGMVIPDAAGEVVTGEPFIEREIRGPWTVTPDATIAGVVVDHKFDIPVDLLVMIQAIGYCDAASDSDDCNPGGDAQLYTQLAPDAAATCGDLTALVANGRTDGYIDINTGYAAGTAGTLLLPTVEGIVSAADGECVGLGGRMKTGAGTGVAFATAALRMTLVELLDPRPKTCTQTTATETVNFGQDCDAGGAKLGEAMLGGIIDNRGAAGDVTLTIGTWGASSTAADINGASFTANNVNGSNKLNLVPPSGWRWSLTDGIGDTMELTAEGDSVTCYANSSDLVWWCEGDGIDATP